MTINLSILSNIQRDKYWFYILKIQDDPTITKRPPFLLTFTKYVDYYALFESHGHKIAAKVSNVGEPTLVGSEVKKY